MKNRERIKKFFQKINPTYRVAYDIRSQLEYIQRILLPSSLLPITFYGLRKYNFSLPYYLGAMNNILLRYGFLDKVVCEIGSDPLLECSRAAMLLGAREVYSYNDIIELDNSYDDKIKVIKSHFGKENAPESFFDLIFCIAVLEHVPDITTFAETIVKALKPGGNAYLNGGPIWTSSLGHHLWFKDNNKLFAFDNEFNFLDDWYHLSMPSKEQFEKDLLSIGGGVDPEIIPHIWEMTYESDIFNRKTPTEIIQAFERIDGIKTEIVRLLDDHAANKWFDSARKIYPEEDLRTRALEIYITKK